ncbi:MAG TPA: lipid-binding SYLF domain-containing protein [Bryobacteraceae bacterium]|nr:lipid-binding SYLF domain-containing protein [Bryobacteraceae bacterium]
MRLRILALVTLTAASLTFAKEKVKTQERLDEAAEVFSEIMSTPDKGIPQDLLDRSYCVAIVPGLKKGAFILGGKYGKGFVSCRKSHGPGWGPPAAIRVEGGSIGLQIGGSEADVIMLVMNSRGMQKLTASKFTMGGEGEVAAGPVGRDATLQTDALLHAEILSYSRSRGVFAGISLQGATLRQDLDDNQELYGRQVENKDILDGKVAAPSSASRLISLLDKYSARRTS